MVDFVGRYESLEQDYAQIAQRLGIGSDLPYANRSTATTEASYLRAYQTADAINIVDSIYRQDALAFGYSFGCVQNQLGGTAG
jgi:hypothetical protein